MVRPLTFKARHAVPVGDEPRSEILWLRHFEPERADDVIFKWTAECRACCVEAALMMLEEQGRADHLLNMYANLDEERWVMECVWVFNDRDTALMFKLSLS